MKMLKTIVKQFLHKPVTTKFPAEPATSYPATRGHIVFNPANCTSCTMCVKRCPSQAIVIDKTAKTWTIDTFRCVICGSCIELCKFGALSMDTGYSSAATPSERTSSGNKTFEITYVKPEKPKKEAQ